ncbi:Protein GTS1, partial [Diplonema papillatum]
CGVDLSSNMKPPLHGKYALYNDALVMMVLDLKEINQGIDDAPVSGSRWRQVEADVSAASERFGLFAEAVSRTMPEIALTIADGRRRSVTPPRSSSQSPGGEDEVLHVESFSTDEVYFMYPLGATSHTLGELVTLPVNRKCADCAAGVPTWCSIDLGTFICGNCARFHADCLPFRPPANLQTDPFEAEDLDQLARVGNGRANAVWLGLSDRPAQPPAPAQGAGGFREYLLDKYARRKWVPPLHVLESLAPPVEPAEELSTAAPNAWQQQHQQHQQQHQQQQQQQQQHQQQHQQQQQQGAFGFLFGGGDGSAAGASPRSGGLEHEDADCLFPAISAVDARSSVTFPDPVQAQPGPPGSDLDSLFSAPAVNTKPATASGGADDLFSVNDLFSTGSTSPHQQSPGDRATPGGPSARGAPNNKADDPFSDLFGTAQLPKQAAPVQPSAGGKPSDPFAFDF